MGAVIRSEDDKLQFTSVEEDAEQETLFRGLYDKNFPESYTDCVFLEYYLLLLWLFACRMNYGSVVSENERI
jgi:hypothetical protein